MIKIHNTLLKVISMATVILLVFSCSSDEKVNDNPAIDPVDLSKVNTEVDYTNLIIEYLKDGLTDNKEEQIIRLFNQASEDSLINQIITKLASTEVNENNAFIQIHLQWDERYNKPNKVRLGSFVRQTINYPNLNAENAEFIIQALDKRYKGNDFQRASFLCNCAKIDSLSDDATSALIKAINGASGLVKDMHTINKCKEKLNLKANN